jgi:hypothetical protein
VTEGGPRPGDNPDADRDSSEEPILRPESAFPPDPVGDAVFELRYGNLTRTLAEAAERGEVVDDQDREAYERARRAAGEDRAVRERAAEAARRLLAGAFGARKGTGSADEAANPEDEGVPPSGPDDAEDLTAWTATLRGEDPAPPAGGGAAGGGPGGPRNPDGPPPPPPPDAPGPDGPPGDDPEPGMPGPATPEPEPAQESGRPEEPESQSAQGEPEQPAGTVGAEAGPEGLEAWDPRNPDWLVEPGSAAEAAALEQLHEARMADPLFDVTLYGLAREREWRGGPRIEGVDLPRRHDRSELWIAAYVTTSTEPELAEGLLETYERSGIRDDIAEANALQLGLVRGEEVPVPASELPEAVAEAKAIEDPERRAAARELVLQTLYGDEYEEWKEQKAAQAEASMTNEQIEARAAEAARLQLIELQEELREIRSKSKVGIKNTNQDFHYPHTDRVADLERLADRLRDLDLVQEQEQYGQLISQARNADEAKLIKQVNAELDRALTEQEANPTPDRAYMPGHPERGTVELESLDGDLHAIIAQLDADLARVAESGGGVGQSTERTREQVLARAGRELRALRSRAHDWVRVKNRPRASDVHGAGQGVVYDLEMVAPRGKEHPLLAGFRHDLQVALARTEQNKRYHAAPLPSTEVVLAPVDVRMQAGTYRRRPKARVVAGEPVEVEVGEADTAVPSRLRAVVEEGELLGDAQADHPAEVSGNRPPQLELTSEPHGQRLDALAHQLSAGLRTIDLQAPLNANTEQMGANPQRMQLMQLVEQAVRGGLLVGGQGEDTRLPFQPVQDSEAARAFYDEVRDWLDVVEAHERDTGNRQRQDAAARGLETILRETEGLSAERQQREISQGVEQAVGAGLFRPASESASGAIEPGNHPQAAALLKRAGQRRAAAAREQAEIAAGFDDLEQTRAAGAQKAPDAGGASAASAASAPDAGAAGPDVDAEPDEDEERRQEAVSGFNRQLAAS